MKRLALFFALLIPILTFSQIINIPDDYPTIQLGINAAENGDTVLVKPGTYFENINFRGKAITVSSNFIINNDLNVINNTIINGSQPINPDSASVVCFVSGEDSLTVLSGFTLRNGTGTYRASRYGGGIYCINSNPQIRHVIIRENSSGHAGGIFCEESSPLIENTTIINNSAYRGGGVYCYINSHPILKNVIIKNNLSLGELGSGGGIFCTHNSSPELNNVLISNNISEWKGGGICTQYQSNLSLSSSTICSNTSKYGGGIYADNASVIVFDSVQRTSLYENEAHYGKDMFSGNPVNVFLDTCSVKNPSGLYVKPLGNFTCNILNGLIDQLDSDLHVSPDGDDSNSGLSDNDPFKTINHALAVLRVDSLHPHSIHLGNGEYSSSLTGEVFPIAIPDFLTINGESKSNVILNAEEDNNVIGASFVSYFKIFDLTITGGFSDKGGGIFSEESDFVLEELLITSNFADLGAGIYLYHSNPIIKNVQISNNSKTGLSNSRGGGVYSGEYSYPSFENVILSENISYQGGGIYCRKSSPYFKNTTIIKNYAFTGGGLFLDYYSPIFDSINRCNIYQNDATNGKDIFCVYDDYQLHDVIVDTFTVLNPTNYFAKPIEVFNFDILHGLISQVNADLFVSPEGNNTNSGLYPDEPLKTIHHALSILQVDEDSTYNIYLQDGEYSTSKTSERFPITLIDNVNLIGTSASKVILDAEGQSSVIYLNNKVSNEISNVTITGGFSDWIGGGITCEGYESNLKLSNMIITNNKNGLHFAGSILRVESVVISNNSHGAVFNESGAFFQNVTIADNGGGGYFGYELMSEAGFINSIIYNNEESIGIEQAFVSASYSNIEGGWEGEGNIDENPLFLGNGEIPYALSDNSPCIDVGIPDTTGLHVPLFDLAGNPRIWNERVDMGAYEWNSLGIYDLILSNSLLVEIYPNPFSTSTTIEYKLTKPETVKITFYNHFGKAVDNIETRQQSGLNKVIWTPENLADGIYFFRLESGEQMAEGKLILLK